MSRPPRVSLVALFWALATTAFAKANAQNPPGAVMSADGSPSDKPYSIQESSQLTVSVPPGVVTAAYSLDPLIAEAQVADGQIRILGRGPGRAIIVVVNADWSTIAIPVVVAQAPPILPEKPWNGLESSGDSKGFYEVRWSTDPTQISDLFDYRSNDVQLHLTNANVPDRGTTGQPTTWFPFAYARFLASRSTLTLFDDNVDSSPISIRSTLLRGMHVTTGELAFHAGFTSVAGFQSLLLPVDRQMIVGATLRHPLNAALDVGVTGYYVQPERTSPGQIVSREVGTAFVKAHGKGTEAPFEAGVSGRVGGAFELSHRSEHDQIHASARYRPPHYAVSETDNLRGFQGEARWERGWSKAFDSTFSGSDNHLFTSIGVQDVAVGTLNLRHKVGGGFSLSSAATGSRFYDNRSSIQGVRRLDVPLTVSYDAVHIGASAQYGYSTTDRALSLGRRYQGALRLSGRRIQVSANAGLDRQALGIDSVFSAFPTLNVELAQLGLSATSNTEQLGALLANRAFLSNLGLAPTVSLQLVPRNRYGGMSVGWRGSKQLLEFDARYNVNAFLTTTETTILQTLRYRRSVFGTSELVSSWTLLEQRLPEHRIQPVIEVGLRHQLGAHPFRPQPDSKGSISGTVRLEDSSGNRPAQAVVMTLDGDRRVVTDARGQYRFTNVSRGTHVVQARFESSRSFWYTTPSKVTTETDSIVDFGVIYPSAQIMAHAIDDAGVGLPNVSLTLTGPQGKRTVTTDQSGAAVIPVEQSGTYEVVLNAETIPNGYALEEMRPSSVSLKDGESRVLTFTLTAIRSLAGAVRGYDNVAGAYVAIPGVVLQLKELNRRIVTGQDGRFVSRDLPSGTFTLLVDGEPYSQVEIGAAPRELRQDVRLTSIRTPAAPNR